MASGKLLRSFSTYTFVSLFGSAAGFILMPFLTHHLTTSDYGSLSLFNVFVQLTVPLIGLSAAGLTTVEHFNKEIQGRHFRELFSSISIIPLLTFFPIILICHITKSQISELTDLSEEVIIFIPLIALFSVYVQQFYNYVIVLKESTLFGIANISKTIIEYSFALLLIIALGRGWFGRVEATLIVLLPLAILSFFFYKKWDLLTLSVKWLHMKAGLLYGVPLVAHVIGRFVINQSDKVFIANMVSKEELGIYNTGYLVGSIIMILAGAFANVYNPFLFERLSSITKDKELQIVRMSYVFILSLSFICLLLTLIAPYLYVQFIDPRYAKGANYVGWIGMSYVFWGGYMIFSGVLYYLKKTNYLSILALLNTALNLILNYYMIKQFGPIGAAYATAVSFFIVFVLVALISNRLHPLPWLNFKEILSRRNA